MLLLLLFFSAPPAPEVITPGLEQEDGWIIIQRRVDASVSFEKTWDEYVAGFGDVDGNFWLGLEVLHDLTEAQPMSLQIDVVPCNIPAISIPYQQIHVGDATSKYRLTITSDTPGDNTPYNSMNYHSGIRFSTYDNDNDITSSRHCAEEFRAGWWFKSCGRVYLNGVYSCDSVLEPHHIRMFYLNDNEYEPIRTVTMKLRAII